MMMAMTSGGTLEEVGNEGNRPLHVVTAEPLDFSFSTHRHCLVTEPRLSPSVMRK
jgi:hypothetical protein